MLSPLIWDLGHIANFEQRWLLGDDDADDDLAASTTRSSSRESVRGELPVLAAEQCFEYMSAVRERVDAALGAIDPFTLELVLQHEQQHNETMLQMLRMMDDYAPPAGLRRDDRRASPKLSRATPWIEYPAGDYAIGTPHPAAGGFAYDNESGRHDVQLGPFAVARLPVLNGEYREWVESSAAPAPPLGWLRDGGDWFETGFGEPRPLDDRAPVVHVDWFEADAYARAHGARLPSEFEWEVAASFTPGDGPAGERRSQPWGDDRWRPELRESRPARLRHACLRSADQASAAPIDMARPGLGVDRQRIRRLSRLRAVFLRALLATVLRPGLSRAARRLVGHTAASVDNRFRNWDLPQRRQIFAGFRLARDVVVGEDVVYGDLVVTCPHSIPSCPICGSTSSAAATGSPISRKTCIVA